MQCLSSKGSANSTAPTQALAALLQAAGTSLRQLNLDGCFAGGGLLPRLVHSCPAVEAVSLIGCTGLGDADLAALAELPQLRDLAVGGATLAWHEHHALTGRRGRNTERVRK